jgi:hypothetical protein
MLPQPVLPGRFSTVKEASVGSVIRNALVGNKTMRPSELASVRKYITESGHPTNPRGGILRNLLVGSPDALNIIRSRFAQGGVLGRGGLIRGELAPDPALIASLRRIYQGNPLPTRAGIGAKGKPLIDSGDYLRSAGLGANYALHLGLGLGIPYLGVREALKSSDPAQGVGQSLGEGAGYLLGGPLGLTGLMLAGGLGGSAGASAGRAVSAATTPVQMATPLPGNYGSLNSQLSAYAPINDQIAYY